MMIVLLEWLLGSWSLPWPKALLAWLLSLVRWPTLGSVLVVPNFFHFTSIEATLSLGTLKASEIILYPYSDRYLTKQFLTCSVNCGTLYTLVCAFLNNVQSIQFTTGATNGGKKTCWLMSKDCNFIHLKSVMSRISGTLDENEQKRL